MARVGGFSSAWPTYGSGSSQHDQSPAISPPFDATFEAGKRLKVTDDDSEPHNGIKKKTRVRKPASCLHCRTKKLRCNRVSPCSACSSRGVECEWEAGSQPLMVARDETDAAELKAQIDRLQQLVDSLADRQMEEMAASKRDRRRSSNDESKPPALIRNGSNSTLSSSNPSPTDQWPDETDLRASDITEHLSQLAISHIGGPEAGPKASNELVEEARKLCEAGASQYFGLSNHFGVPTASNDVLKSFSYTRPAKRTLQELLNVRSREDRKLISQNLPPPQQAQSALSYYRKYLQWYLPLCHEASFQQCMAATHRALTTGDLSKVSPAFLAYFFAICAQAVTMMPAGRLVRDGFSLPAREATVANWMACATDALHLADFLERPTVDSIRAMLAVGSYFVFMASGDSSGIALNFLVMASTLATNINLHRDPDHFPGKYNVLEAEERRRLWWQMIAYIELASASLGGTWPTPSSAHTDVKVPADADDADVTPEGIKPRPASSDRETMMTSILVRISIAKISKRVLFGCGSVSYQSVLRFEQELAEIEANLHSRYRLPWVNGNIEFPNQPVVLSFRTLIIHIAITQERLRIHRPFLMRGQQYDKSRKACLDAASTLLAIQRSTMFRSSPFGGLLYKALCAAVVLAIDLLQQRRGSAVEMPQAQRDEITHAITLLEQASEWSGIARKGARLLKFLLDKDRMAEEQRLDRSQSKRARMAEDNASRLAQSLAAPVAQPPSATYELPHKRTQQISPVQRISPVASTSAQRTPKLDAMPTHVQPMPQPNHQRIQMPMTYPDLPPAAPGFGSGEFTFQFDPAPFDGAHLFDVPDWPRQTMPTLSHSQIKTEAGMPSVWQNMW